MIKPHTIDTLNEFADGRPVTGDQLLPVLHRVQSRHGYIPESAMVEIAQLLNISRAEVFGVVSFYDDFALESVRVSVAICGAEACQALGCRELLAQAKTELSPEVSVKEVFCLGNCACGPSARVGDRVLARATIAAITRALESLEWESEQESEQGS